MQIDVVELLPSQVVVAYCILRSYISPEYGNSEEDKKINKYFLNQ
jgi:hypothetical protein